jgi:phospholipase A1
MADWEGCSAIPADTERLACYDRISGRSQPEATRGTVSPSAPQTAQTPAVAPVAPPEPKLLSALSRHWELDDEAKQGTFLFRPHRPTYFLPIKYSSAPNNTPYRDVFTQPDLGLERIETELQLSFKVKGMQGVFGHDNVDLWLGYTTTSFWQAYNHNISAPFRETNYEPEAMLVFRTNYELAGFRGRFVNLGLSHQSNGRGEGLSRSWNRVYAQFGFERGNLAVLVRPWIRIPESSVNDDNPDIEDYMGHGDVLAVYRKGRNAYSLLLRNNLRTSDNRGALKLNWSFPLHGRLKGYVQYFNGYGESLIDYNHRQQSLGLGISLAEGM